MDAPDGRSPAFGPVQVAAIQDRDLSRVPAGDRQVVPAVAVQVGHLDGREAASHRIGGSGRGPEASGPVPQQDGSPLPSLAGGGGQIQYAVVVHVAGGQTVGGHSRGVQLQQLPEPAPGPAQPDTHRTLAGRGEIEHPVAVQVGHHEIPIRIAAEGHHIPGLEASLPGTVERQESPCAPVIHQEIRPAVPVQVCRGHRVGMGVHLDPERRRRRRLERPRSVVQEQDQVVGLVVGRRQVHVSVAVQVDGRQPRRILARPVLARPAKSAGSVAGQDQDAALAGHGQVRKTVRRELGGQDVGIAPHVDLDPLELRRRILGRPAGDEGEQREQWCGPDGSDGSGHGTSVTIPWSPRSASRSPNSATAPSASASKRSSCSARRRSSSPFTSSACSVGGKSAEATLPAR